MKPYDIISYEHHSPVWTWFYDNFSISFESQNSYLSSDNDVINVTWMRHSQIITQLWLSTTLLNFVHIIDRPLDLIRDLTYSRPKTLHDTSLELFIIDFGDATSLGTIRSQWI